MLVVFSTFQGTLEDSILFQLLDDGEERTSLADHRVKNYSLSQLMELQNKPMLIAIKVEEGREEANQFLEVSHSTAPTSAPKMVAVGLGVLLELFLEALSMICSCGHFQTEAVFGGDGHFPNFRSAICFPQHCSSLVGPNSPFNTFLTSLWKDSWSALSWKEPLKIV